MKKLNERLKIIRKHFGKTQKDFGAELGVSRDTYASYESGRVIPNNTFVQLLCSTFSVNEEWLRNGAGEMFMQTPQTILDDLVTAHNLNGREKAIISAFLDLSPEGRAAIIEYVEKVARGFADIPTVISREDMIARRIVAADKKIAEEIGVKKQ